MYRSTGTCMLRNAPVYSSILHSTHASRLFPLGVCSRYLNLRRFRLLFIVSDFAPAPPRRGEIERDHEDT